MAKYREVTKNSYGGRLKGAFGGIVVGLIMFVVAFPVQWWNEGRAVRRAIALEEGAGMVVTVANAKLDQANEGKLVHVSGQVSSAEQLTDSEFAVEVNALGLRRKVEMYQWKEDRDTEERKTLGGGSETITTYEYKQSWNDDLIDSSQFHQSGYDNPSKMPVSSRRQKVNVANLGDYVLSQSLLGELSDWKGLPLSKLKTNPPQGFVLNSQDQFYLGGNPNSPKIGDVRVEFSTIPEGPYSVVSKQVGNSFAAYQTKNKNEIELLDSGLVSAEQMFASAKTENTILTWVLRVVGFMLMWIGMGMMLKPLSVLFDVIPFLGTLVEKGLGFVSGILAFVFSLITIALAWIWYRPLLGIALLVLVVGSVVWLKKRAPKSLPATTHPNAMPPPPPPPPSA